MEVKGLSQNGKAQPALRLPCGHPLHRTDMLCRLTWSFPCGHALRVGSAIVVDVVIVFCNQCRHRLCAPRACPRNRLRFGCLHGCYRRRYLCHHHHEAEAVARGA